jgi:hypothetical protein
VGLNHIKSYGDDEMGSKSLIEWNGAVSEPFDPIPDDRGICGPPPQEWQTVAYLAMAIPNVDPFDSHHFRRPFCSQAVHHLPRGLRSAKCPNRTNEVRLLIGM